jgi:hypothetical protein
MPNNLFAVTKSKILLAGGSIVIVALLIGGYLIVHNIYKSDTFSEPVSEQADYGSPQSEQDPKSTEKSTSTATNKTDSTPKSNTTTTKTNISPNKSGGISGSSAGGGTTSGGGNGGTGGTTAGTFRKNCIVVPSACGYPDATNTGVPAGTTLTNSGSISVTVDGTIIQNKNITGSIDIQANNVIIRNSRITSGTYYPIRVISGTGLLVEDSEIIGTNTDVTSAVSFTNYTARRVYVHGTVDGFKADENVVIEDSYVTGLRYDEAAQTHNDGVQTTGGTNVTIRHNTFKIGDVAGMSSVMQMGTEWSDNTNWLVENNLMDGGGWTINGRSQNPSMRYLNNRFTHRYQYGVMVDSSGSTWTNNYFDEDGSPAS